MTTLPSRPAGPPASEQEAVVMSWLDHARELRNRLVKATIAVLVGVVVGFVIIQYDNFGLITRVIQHFVPPSAHLQAIAVGEKFTNAMQIAFGIGLGLAMPVLVYQLLAFIVPGLTVREQRIIYFMLPLITGCFGLGLLFGWWVTIPIAVTFLLDYGPQSIQASPTFEQFAGFLVHLLLLNGLVFELPVLVYAIVWLGVVERATLARYRRYAVLAMSIFAAVITPTTDLASYATAAIPLYLLYEVGLLFARFVPARHKPAS